MQVARELFPRYLGKNLDSDISSSREWFRKGSRGPQKGELATFIAHGNRTNKPTTNIESILHKVQMKIVIQAPFTFFAHTNQVQTRSLNPNFPQIVLSFSTDSYRESPFWRLRSLFRRDYFEDKIAKSRFFFEKLSEKFSGYPPLQGEHSNSSGDFLRSKRTKPVTKKRMDPVST